MLQKPTHSKFLNSVIILLSVIIFIFVLLVAYRLFAVDTSLAFSKPVLVDIPSGASTAQVARFLVKAGVLKYPTIFVFTARITGKHKQIRAGRFSFSRPLSTWQILVKITRGGSFDVSITIPEGFNIFEIAGLVEEKLNIDSVAFIAACADTQLLKRLNIYGPTAEGFLFPETYHIPLGLGADSVISIMHNEFVRRWRPQYTARTESLKMEMLAVVTLASIIEKEAHIKEEQTVISSVYHNRLRLGMMLQADPTTIYGLRKFNSPLLLKDLDSDSPYNTYRYFGLPPGPICNPGEDAIIAALYPDSTEYLYFVSRRDGTHIFSETIQQHHRAIRQVKQMLRNLNWK